MLSSQALGQFQPFSTSDSKKRGVGMIGHQAKKIQKINMKYKDLRWNWDKNP